jgi:multiple sugar transport system permease protein/raffinose/stachyose/melibiose transport system permease protein
MKLSFSFDRSKRGKRTMNVLKSNRTTQQIGLVFIAPAMILFFVYVLYPIGYILVNSLYEWDGVNERIFVGFRNYVQMFQDDVFLISLRNVFYWIILTIFPQMFIGFIFAFILNHELKGRTAFRAILYMPAIISPVVIGIIWQRIFNPFGGFLSDIGLKTGLTFLVQPYISDPNIAIFSVIAVNVWQWTGWSMLLYLAGMQSIDDEIFESTRIEGISKWQEIRFIVWPMLKGTHLTLILLGVIGALQTFDLVYTLTNGGPNNASQMLSTYIFLRSFRLQSMGYGSAMSVFTLVLALGLSLFQIKVLGAKFQVVE